MVEQDFTCELKENVGFYTYMLEQCLEMDVAQLQVLG